MAAALSDNMAWHLIEEMLLIRRFEEAVLKLSGEGHFSGHYHLYIGQEATGTVVMTALDERDKLATTHRNHGHILARGGDPKAAMAEILGRATGVNGGRGGTIHLCAADLGFIQTSGIVGGCISLGVGGGYACKQKRDGSISAVFFGDGALEEGVSFEALNLASLWKLPVLFMCENNSTGSFAPGEGYPTLVHAGGADLGAIPRSVGIHTLKIDGADAAAMAEAVDDAVARCRSGNGPVFIEAMTRRWPGNNPLWPELVTGLTDIAMATGEKPIVGGEHTLWLKGHDPILRLGRELAAKGGDAVARLKAIDRSVNERIDEAVKFALASPRPSVETVNDHVFG